MKTMYFLLKNRFKLGVLKNLNQKNSNWTKLLVFDTLHSILLYVNNSGTF